MSARNSARISVIIPAYNEEGNVKVISEKIIMVLKDRNPFEIIFIDDGSMDSTLENVKELSRNDNRICFLSFSRNFGHQNALRAGIESSTGSCVITMDADMQHPPELLTEMIAKWEEGYDIVYTVREDNKGVPFIKRLASRGFYGLLSRISDINLEKGSADFRLMDKKIVGIINNIQEHNLFLRGMISWLGFKTYKINYKVGERYSGNTKYSFLRMINFAIGGITSFSIKPLYVSVYLGLVISTLTFIYGLYAVLVSILSDLVISGWTSLIVSILFIGGIQLLVLGIIGIYIAKIFIEVKNRPKYVIKEISENLIKNNE